MLSSMFPSILLLTYFPGRIYQCQGYQYRPIQFAQSQQSVFKVSFLMVKLCSVSLCPVTVLLKSRPKPKRSKFSKGPRGNSVFQLDYSDEYQKQNSHHSQLLSLVYWTFVLVFFFLGLLSSERGMRRS